MKILTNGGRRKRGNLMARILVIDDDPMARIVISEMLISEGHEPFMANDGSEGLEAFFKEKFDLVITDIIMPGVEGIQTIIELRKKFQDVKIIAVSGGGRLGAYSHLELAEKIGAQKTLAKPIRKSKLLDAVNELLDSE